jgi:hypothetical protein
VITLLIIKGYVIIIYLAVYTDSLLEVRILPSIFLLKIVLASFAFFAYTIAIIEEVFSKKH